MADRIIIEHKDGRRFSVTPADHKKLYPDFKVEGEETDASFVATGIPAPKRARKRPAAKKAAPVAPAPAPEPAPAAAPEA